MQKIKALYLDFDGTLVDSLDALYSAYQAFLSAFKIAGSQSEFRELNGPSISEIVEILKARHSLSPSVQELTEFYRQCVKVAYGDVTFKPEVLTVLRRARELGLNTCIVTSNSESFVREFVHREGLSEFFDSIVGIESVGKGKPSPVIYLKAIELLGSASENGIAIEDSLNGVSAAIAAGLRVCHYVPSESGAKHRTQQVERIHNLNDVIPLLERGV